MHYIIEMPIFVRKSMVAVRTSGRIGLQGVHVVTAEQFEMQAQHPLKIAKMHELNTKGKK